MQRSRKLKKAMRNAIAYSLKASSNESTTDEQDYFFLKKVVGYENVCISNPEEKFQLYKYNVGLRLCISEVLERKHVESKPCEQSVVRVKEWKVSFHIEFCLIPTHWRNPTGSVSGKGCIL